VGSVLLGTTTQTPDAEPGPITRQSGSMYNKLGNMYNMLDRNMTGCQSPYGNPVV